MAETYAIIESGGKQYRVEEGETLLVDRLPDDEGARVNLRAVMFRDGKNVILEGSKLEKVKVEAVVAGHRRGEKIRVFKYRAKKGYRKRQGHRSELTELEVAEVTMLTRKPAAKDGAGSREQVETKAESAVKKPAAKKPAAKKKAPAKKPAAKKAPAKASGKKASEKKEG